MSAPAKTKAAPAKRKAHWRALRWLAVPVLVLLSLAVLLRVLSRTDVPPDMA